MHPSSYQVTLALAGFRPDEITITAAQNILTVKASTAQKRAKEYLYQGISARPFRTPEKDKGAIGLAAWREEQRPFSQM